MTYPHRTQQSTSPHMTSRARNLRREAPVPERILWGMLRNRRLNGLKFRRQVPIGPYVVDYFCECAKLIIELDGMTHDERSADKDDRRTAYLHTRGLRILRVTNDDLLKSPEAVWQTISQTTLQT